MVADDFSIKFFDICRNDKISFYREEEAYDADVEDILMNIFSAVEVYSPSWQEGDPPYIVNCEINDIQVS
jgi:hypothetical protein